MQDAGKTPVDQPEDFALWEIAQNEQIAGPDGPVSREELEQLMGDGQLIVSDYSL